MTTIEYVVTIVFPAAMKVLPPQMDSPEARAMLLAIGLQESRFMYRRQVRGPAHGFFQFEENGGVRGVLEHPSSQRAALNVLDTLHYPGDPHAIYVALEHNDVLLTGGTLGFPRVN